MDEFISPRLGAGQVYEIMAENISSRGGSVVAAVEGLVAGNRIVAALVEGDQGRYEVEGNFF